MENTWGHTCFCTYSLKIYMKAQKHACFHVFSNITNGCADVALCQSCHVLMLPCDLLSCADVAL